MLSPVFKKDVKWDSRALAALVITADKASHSLLDVLRELKGNKVLSRTMMALRYKVCEIFSFK